MRDERYHSHRYPLSVLLMGAAIVWVVLRRPFRVAVEGRSMAPTLAPDDFLLATRSGPIRRGALLVVEHPHQPGYDMVKRLAGVPGDRVAGRALGPDEFWLVGDNPEGSTDSRTLGPFPRRSIRGTVRFRYWPPERIGWLGPASSTRHLRSVSP